MTKPFNRSTIQRVKAYAFTLAETLIVIGIIGVVAALTLPNLNHATGDKEKVTKVKKIYASLTDAVDRAQAVYGNADEWFKDIAGDNEACAERFAKRVTEFMKVSKDCGFDEGCFSSAPLLFSNSYTREDDDGNQVSESVSFDNLLEEMQYTNYMVMTSDGMSLGFRSNNGAVEQITVDIDGPNKGKNQEGNDIFYFSFGLQDSCNDGGDTCKCFKYLQLIPDITQDMLFYYCGSDFCGYSTAWVIENGNLDYLKCPDELNWETKTSCE